MANNFSAKILGNAISSLNAQQAVIANASNNIANVNTEGYTRRKVVLETRSDTTGSGLSLGNGVKVGDVQRVSDEFLENILRDTIGEQSSAETQSGFLDRVQALFSLSGNAKTIGTTMTDFFNSLEDLKTNPASIELRANVLERAEDLVQSIRDTFSSLANLQSEADQRLQNEVQTINSLTQQIANLNTLVESRESSGVTAADERDQRNRILNQLAQKVSFSVVETSGGAINVSLSNGFPLVTGATVRQLETTANPSFGTAGPMLNGGALSSIVYDYDQTGAAPAHIDLTSILANGEGTVGGLLEVRGTNAAGTPSPFAATGDLVEVALEVEQVAVGFLLYFNEAYAGPDLVAAGTHQISSVDLDGNAITDPFAFFSATGLTDVVSGGADEGIASSQDIQNAYANGVPSLASRITLAITDPRAIATRQNLAGNIGGTGDTRILDLLTAVRTQSENFGNDSQLPGVSTTSTRNLEEIYTGTVNIVGNKAARAAIDSSVSTDNLIAVQRRRDEISAVSLDEEFSSLITFQRAFEASARMIRIADEILQQVIQLI
ncbi:MAG: flagellar hook-associated protein FlgK [Bdellovibrionota bacterium]